MRDDDILDSADQDAWVALATAIREQLARRVPDMGAMNPGELQQFVDTVGIAQQLGILATTHDHQVDVELRRLTYMD